MVLFVVTRINEWMLPGRDYEQLRGKKTGATHGSQFITRLRPLLVALPPITGDEFSSEGYF
jgi:hypothetical protein